MVILRPKLLIQNSVKDNMKDSVKDKKVMSCFKLDIILENQLNIVPKL